MLKYCTKRLLIMIPILLGISFIVFAIINMAPGDAARMILGQGATEGEIEALRESLGLNENFFLRYFKYIFNVICGNLGTSYRSSATVAGELGARIPTTLKLAVGSILLTILFGVLFGVIAAVKRNTALDAGISVCALTLTSVPSFWLGLLLMLVFALKLQLVPSIGSDSWKCFILPCITLSASSIGSVTRMTRTSVLEVIEQDYVRTARSKGLRESVVIFRHVLRNSLLPIITTIGLNFASLMGGAVVTENVFGMSGIGTLLVNSVGSRDTPMIMGCVLFIATVICVINLVTDILYTFVDPRLRIKG